MRRMALSSTSAVPSAKTSSSGGCSSGRSSGRPSALVAATADGAARRRREALVEVGSGSLDFSCAAGAVFPMDTDEAVRALVEKEGDHLPQDGYAERLEHGGLESSWRKDAMDWICKHDKPWMQQLLSVACLSLAVKMEETVVPLPMDLQVCDAKFVFEARTIGRMEFLVLTTLKWRMQAVTPVSFISYFLDKFSEGKPWSFALASRSAEIIVGTPKGSTFLSFRPSEIAAAVVLAVVSENQVVGFGSVLAASEIPETVNKEMIVRCCELMQEWALVKKGGHSNGSPSVPQSPIVVLDAGCFSFRSDDATLGSSQSNNNSGNKKSTTIRLLLQHPGEG